MLGRILLAGACFVTAGLDARAEVFYTVKESTDTLCTIDTSTGILTPIGPLNAAFAFGDLAFDSSTGTMYMSNGWGQGSGVTSSLYTVDLNTGNATLVGPMNAIGIFGLVYDPVTNKLYGSVSTSNPKGFYEINRATGAAVYIGDPTHNLDGLTYVGSTGQIAGLWAGPGSLHKIDRSTGVSALLTAGSGFVNNCGIAWAPSNDSIYAIDWSGNLYAYDVQNGYARTTVASSLGACDGLALAGASCPLPATYCTAGTTTNGCAASIGSTGTPNVGNTSGFVLTVSNVEGQKAGILFYGTNNTGFTPTPWALGSTSWLCVKAPTQRMTTQNSGGTIGQCDGALSIDWLAYLAANPGALGQPLSAGQEFFGQAWFRDPPAPKTTNLSDALKWTVCP